MEHPKSLNFVSIFRTIHLKLGSFWLPRNFSTTSLKAFQASYSLSYILDSNALSFISLLMSGPTKTPSLSLASDSPENFSPKYLKQSPSPSRAFTKCFISPSLMWSGGSRTLLGSTKLSRRTFLLPGTRDVLLGHTSLVQCLAQSRLSHSQRKQGYFVFPPCCPSSIEITFKSPHMVHAWSLYLILLRIKSKFSYLSFKCTECPIGNDAYLFPLCRRTALKLLLDESINSLHSLASCWMLNLVISLGMSLQYTNSPS